MFRTSEKFTTLAYFLTKTTMTAKATTSSTAKGQEDKGKEQQEENKKNNKFTEKKQHTHTEETRRIKEGKRRNRIRQKKVTQ